MKHYMYVVEELKPEEENSLKNSNNINIPSKKKNIFYCFKGLQLEKHFCVYSLEVHFPSFYCSISSSSDTCIIYALCFICSSIPPSRKKGITNTIATYLMTHICFQCQLFVHPVLLFAHLSFQSLLI